MASSSRAVVGEVAPWALARARFLGGMTSLLGGEKQSFNLMVPYARAFPWSGREALLGC